LRRVNSKDRVTCGVDAQGAAHLALRDQVAVDPAHVVVDADGQSTTTYPILTPAMNDGWGISPAFDTDGDLHLSWVFQDLIGICPYLQYAVFDGSSWSDPKGIPGTGFRAELGTSLAIDRQGNPHIAYCNTGDWTISGA
jgi:hypothetical protein